MKIDILTLFPEMCYSFINESIIGRAIKKGSLDITCYNFRDYTNDKHGRVDDYPYGGGQGMLLQAQPIYDCYMDIAGKSECSPHFIYMSPKGQKLTQNKVKELADKSHIIILCGHYEGVDQRLLDKLKPEEISVGDYVLTGGELPALLLADAVSRLIPGVLSQTEAFSDESHYNHLLEYPQYTRPSIWKGMEVPEVLLSGHHKNIKDWQHKESLIITKKLRSDLLTEIESDKSD